LRRIFDDAQIVFGGNRIQAIHVDRQARQVDRDDGLGARRDGGFQFVQINVACDRIDVGEYRRGAGFDDDIGGGYPRNRVVITSSPGPMPAMRSAISMVQVPELKLRVMRPSK